MVIYRTALARSLIALTVTTASVQDRDGAKLLFATIQNACQCLTSVWADGAYMGYALAWKICYSLFITTNHAANYDAFWNVYWNV